MHGGSVPVLAAGEPVLELRDIWAGYGETTVLRGVDLVVPASSVVAARTFSMSAGLLASTVTPGSTAPVASLTEPAITLCAAAPPGNSSRSAQPIVTTKAILVLTMSSLRSSALR